MDPRVRLALVVSLIAAPLVLLAVWGFGGSGGADSPAIAVFTDGPPPTAAPLRPADSLPAPATTPTVEPTPGIEFPRIDLEGDELIPEAQAAPPAPPPPEAVYIGTLGMLGFDEIVAAPVTDPPPPVGAGVAPLTGLTADQGLIDRPAVLVKVDNAEAGRPQEGITAADLVYEEMVEGGITRLAAVFHTADSAVGPIRSARTTDIAIIGSLNRPILGWSGANSLTAKLILEQPLVDRGMSSTAAYFRSTARPAPHNLMTDTASLRSGVGGAAPPTMFVFRAPDGALGGNDTNQFTVSFPASSATWSWNGAVWIRAQNGSAHVDAAGTQIQAQNVIVQTVPYVLTGMGDTTGAAVLEALSVGTGSATVYTGGRAIAATWTKPSLSAVTTYTDGAGQPIALTPGQTWIELVPR